MGIRRDTRSRSGHSGMIDDRISSARRGAGLHGENGGGPKGLIALWSSMSYHVFYMA